MYVEYRATTLAELIEVCQAIHNEAIAQAKGPVDPAEIVLNGPVWKGLDFTLTDGYDCPSGYGIEAHIEDIPNFNPDDPFNLIAAGLCFPEEGGAQ